MEKLKIETNQYSNENMMWRTWWNKAALVEDFSPLEQPWTMNSHSNLTNKQEIWSKTMKIKLKPMLDTMLDHHFCTRNHPFKIELEHPQPHNRGKVNRHELQRHHELWCLPRAARGEHCVLCLISSLLPQPWKVRGNRGNFISSSLKVKCQVKTVKNLHTFIKGQYPSVN